MKVYVEIEVPQSFAEYHDDQEDWHPNGDPSIISIDKSNLRPDPDRSEAVVFKLIGVTP